MGRNRRDNEVIRILHHKSNQNSYQIVSNNAIFQNEYLVCHISHDRIKIRAAGIDDTKHVRKSSREGVSYRFTITSHNVELPLGDLKINKELSNDDQIVIFLKQ